MSRYIYVGWGFIAKVGDTGTDREMLVECIVCVKVEIAVGGYTSRGRRRIYNLIDVFHATDVAPAHGAEKTANRVSDFGVGLLLGVRNIAGARVIANAARIVQCRRTEQAGNLVILQVRNDRGDRDLAGFWRHAQPIEAEAPVDLRVDTAHGISGKVEQALLARRDRATRRITLDALAISIGDRVRCIAHTIRIKATRQYVCKVKRANGVGDFDMVIINRDLKISKHRTVEARCDDNTNRVSVCLLWRQGGVAAGGTLHRWREPYV